MIKTGFYGLFWSYVKMTFLTVNFKQKELKIIPKLLKNL